MNPIDKRAIAESKKPDNQRRYAVVQKIWGRYSVILRKTKKDAMGTYNAAKGYKSAVAYEGKLIAGAIESVPAGFVQKRQVELLCASDLDGHIAQMTVDNADEMVTIALPGSRVTAEAPSIMLYLTDLQRFVDTARRTLEASRFTE